MENISEQSIHKIDKALIPVCNIMGVNIAAIDMKWLIDFTRNNIKKLDGDYCCVANVHTTVMSWENREYCEIQNKAVLAIPDGGPLSVIGRKRGFRNMKRTCGPDYMEEIFKISVQEGYRHFFYGAEEETLRRLRKNIEKMYPGIHIVGMYSPPFRPLSKEEDIEIVNKIASSHPDFLWVGLGAPKQEKWMADHKRKISGFMVGVGAGFDYFAGNIRRAPMWMQKCNMEWAYRLMQEPGRLFGRYLHTNISFLWNAWLRGR